MEPLPSAQSPRPALVKEPWKSEIEPLPQCAISHENQSKPWIPRQWLQPHKNDFIINAFILNAWPITWTEGNLHPYK